MRHKRHQPQNKTAFEPALNPDPKHLEGREGYSHSMVTPMGSEKPLRGVSSFPLVLLL